MRNNRLLVTAIVLIALGLTGIFIQTLSSGFGRRGMPVTAGMMGGGMIGRGQMREMMQRMMPEMLPPVTTPESLPDPDSVGAKLLNLYCTQCHNLPSPAMHTAEQWPQIVNRMFARMSMMSDMMGIEGPTKDEKEEIVHYLQSYSMKSISPSSLPSPKSQEAILFRNTCSQCHALPDPKLHTFEEWPKVVERMLTNMRTMGKTVITEKEKKEIVGYLVNHAHK